MKPSGMILTVWTLIYLNAALWTCPTLLKATEKAESQCIACHTNLKNLIRLCWQVEALKPKHLKSEETSGEG